jgi:predicted extracellular nuclease
MGLRYVIAALALATLADHAVADSTPQGLPFSQNWTNTGLITTNDNWSAVPGIEGFLGQDIVTASGVDPQTVTGVSTLANDLDVIANQANPSTAIFGGVGEFEIANPVVAIAGSNTADAPYLLLNLNTTGQQAITVAYGLRDIDGSGDNSVQPVALQFRVGNTGAFTNVPAGFVADASSGPTLATLVTPVSATLPSTADNQPLVQVRVITTNAGGNDEYIGIDDINVTGTPIGQPNLTINDASVTEGNTGTRNAVFTVSLSSPAGAGGVSFTIATADDTATQGLDYVAQNLSAQTIAEGQSTYTFNVQVNGDEDVEGNETFLVVVSKITGAESNPETSTGTGTIIDDDAATTTLSIADPAAIAEGDTGTRAQNFIVTLGSPLAADVAFTATTSAGTATAADFTPLAASPFTISAGQTTATVPVAIIGDLADESAESYTLTIASSAPGVTLGQSTATGTINDDDDAPVEIHAIQGSGLRSPLAPGSGNGNGQVVITAGNVVTGIGPNGFSIQTPAVRSDPDPLTSQGLFVFTSTAPPASLAIGDVVTVKGAVAEFFNFTQITGAPVVLETGTDELPPPIVFDQDLPSRDPANLSCGPLLGNFECFEGMLVSVPAGVVNSGNQFFASDPVAEVFASAVGTRARREAGVRSGIAPPANPPTVPVWDGNPEVFEIDADRLIPANANRVIAGGSLFSAVGVIGFDFGAHELWPTSLDVVEETLPRPVPVPEQSRWLSVASFNVLRLCDTTAVPPTGQTTPADGCLMPTPTQADVTLKLGRISDYIRNVLRSPDVVGLQEVETLALAEQLATRIAADGGPIYTAFLAEGNDPGGIDVGYLVRGDRVTSVSVRQLGLADRINDPAGCSTQNPAPCVLHDRPPYLLRGTFSADGANYPFAVINNHLRSRGGVDSGSETARVRLKRFLQAQGVATFAQRFQTGQELEPANPTGSIATANVPLLVLGDMNAFEVTDGWADLVGVMAGTYDNAANELQLASNIVVPPMLQAANTVPLEERYSYMFVENFGNVQAQAPREVGNVQVLDHVLVNAVAQPRFRRAVFGRTNADAAETLRRTGLGAVGVSDHDAIVVYLDAAPDGIFSNGFEPQAPRQD